MPLKSKLFTEDPTVKGKLEACLADPDHIFRGHRGKHVGRIQRALVTLGAGVVDQPKLVGMIYGFSTARTVRSYKQNHKPPIQADISYDRVENHRASLTHKD